MASHVADVDDNLRAWAKGLAPLEAATEMLIRGGFASPGEPWIRTDEDSAARLWIDFGAIADNKGHLPVGEQKFVTVAASLAANSGHRKVELGKAIHGLDRRLTALVLAAVSHANGSQHDRDPLTGRFLGPLFPWPRR